MVLPRSSLAALMVVLNFLFSPTNHDSLTCRIQNGVLVSLDFPRRVSRPFLLQEGKVSFITMRPDPLSYFGRTQLSTSSYCRNSRLQ